MLHLRRLASTCARSKAFSSMTASQNPSSFKAKDLETTLTKKPHPLIPLDTNLKFGVAHTDHMLTIKWDEQSQWHKPRIVPYGDLHISPMASSLHYAVQCFEGMKAFATQDKKIQVFRPDMNMNRMKSSCVRIGLPDFDGAELQKLILELLKVEKRWVPEKEGFSLYIRPTCIATNQELGVRAPNSALLYVILSPVGPYYPKGFKPVTLVADDKYIRAFPGGVGCYKVGANYGPTIAVSKEYEKKGFSQLLWLVDGNVSEVGTSNIFFYWKNDQGKEELVTPKLDGCILPGVTRDSILKLTKKWNKFDVVERVISMAEVVEKINSGKMIEAFGAGTAAVVSPIDGIHFKGKDYKIPVDPKLGGGKLTNELSKAMNDIYYGRTKSDWVVQVPL